MHVNDTHVVVGLPVLCGTLARRAYLSHAPGLRPTVAHAMASLAAIAAGDVVLDPVCGVATCLVEAAALQPRAHFLAADRDPRQVDAARGTAARAAAAVAVLQGDAAALPVRPGAVDVVLCDLPFGRKHNAGPAGPAALYRAVLRSASRALRPGGRLVALTPLDAELRAALAEAHALRVDAAYPVRLGLTQAWLYHCTKAGAL